MMNIPSDHPSGAHTPARRRAQSISFMVGLAVCLLLAFGFAVEALRGSAHRPVVDDGERINPNDAPVASLMRLPRIGLTRARAISVCRDESARQNAPRPVFTRTEDLQRVKGIGPGIAEDLRPYLQFDTSADRGEP